MATQPQEDADLVEVFATPQESEVMVVHGLLESAGIESAVISGEAQDVLAGVGGMVIRVSPDEADEARRVIEAYKNAPTTDEDEEEAEKDNDEDQEPS